MIRNCGTSLTHSEQSSNVAPSWAQGIPCSLPRWTYDHRYLSLNSDSDWVVSPLSLSLSIAAGPRQHNHSCFLVLRDPWLILLSHGSEKLWLLLFLSFWSYITTDSQSASFSIRLPSEANEQILITVKTFACFSFWLSDESMGLKFITFAGLRQRSRNDLIYTFKYSYETPRAWWVTSRIYISQDQNDPDITPGTGFPIRHLLRFSGLRWRYWTHPHTGFCFGSFRTDRINNNYSLSWESVYLAVTAGKYLPIRCLTVDVFSR
jgi:hypothetical protein